MEHATESEVSVASEPAARPPHRLRQLVTVSWVVTIVGFTLARFFVARETLEGYGLNIWVFGFIDLVTALPYAIGVARVVTAMIDRNPAGASRWAAVAAASAQGGIDPFVFRIRAGDGSQRWIMSCSRTERAPGQPLTRLWFPTL